MHTKTENYLFTNNMTQKLKKMKAELHQLRYYFEQKVEQETAQLSTRIVMLELCNEALCDKLSLARIEIAALKLQQLQTVSACSGKPSRRPALNKLPHKQARLSIRKSGMNTSAFRKNVHL